MNRILRRENLNVDEQTSFVLNHPGMSPWLKDALREVNGLDPVCVLNDLEILRLIVMQRWGQSAADHHKTEA